MDLLNNTNTTLGIIASCLTIVAIVIPILVRSGKSAPSSTSQREQLQPSSPVLAAEPVPLIGRILAAIFGLIAGIIIFAFVFLLPTLLGIFIALVMGERYLDIRRSRLKWEEASRRRNLEWEEAERRDQARMEEDPFFG